MSHFTISTQLPTLALGGATIGANALAVTGTALFNNNLSISGNLIFSGGIVISAPLANSLTFTNGATNFTLTAPAASALQLGLADAAVAVAQTLRVQSVVAGTAAANGANWTLIGSLPTGTGTSGDIIFKTGVKTGSGTTQGTPTTALTIKGETQTVVTKASATGGAGLNLPHGAAPTSPVDGDIWTTTSGLFVRINGATVGPLS